ncbi:hypothetical protein DM77_3688 [Burkholderia mallei]|nr:hypothetical protein DM77_3688 [Burkholderia mallei]
MPGADPAVAFRDHQQPRREPLRGRHQRQRLDVHERHAQLLRHQKRKISPVTRRFVEQLLQRGLRNVHQQRVFERDRIVRARQFVEERDFAEPRRRLGDREKRFLAARVDGAHRQRAAQHRIEPAWRVAAAEQHLARHETARQRGRRERVAQLGGQRAEPRVRVELGAVGFEERMHRPWRCRVADRENVA